MGVWFLRFMCHENDSDLQYSEVPLKGKNKTLVKILGGRDPCNLCGVDAYVASVGRKGGDIAAAGWQVTLYDLMWHVSSRSGEACCILLYPVALLCCT